ncbi:MAG: RNA methyltransferase, partial [Bifidobacteriaceae bacterium]|nr:RNA methyltransferase [Bifidobacteriaceae bacterium]
MLTNTASDRVRRVRRLTRRSARAESGRLLVEGPQACREAALAGLVTDLYFTADAASAHPEIVSATLAAAGRLHQASSDYVSAISSDAQGIAAVAGNPWADWTIAEGLGRAVGRPALVAVFEQVRDPGNAGAVIRAADAAGSDLVVFADQSTDPAAPKAVRASAGSYFHLPVVVIGAISQAIGLARAAGLTVLAADGHGREPLGRAALGQS